MKNIKEYIYEAIEKEAAKKACKNCPIEEGEISSEEDFREYAKNKFEEVFGDDLDKEKMKETIEGILSDNKELVEKEDWGSLVGILNKSFGK